MLSNINLNTNQLSGQIPAALGQLGKLTRLDLNNNQLSGPIPAELGLHTHEKFTSKNPSHLSRTQ